MDLLFKLVSHIWAIPVVLCLLLFLLLKDRDILFRVSLVSIMSIFINTVIRYEIKHTFLDMSLTYEYIRPSAHIQFVVVFYGALFFEMLKNRSLWISSTLSALLVLASCIVALNSNYGVVDVLSAIFVGYFILVLFYTYAIKVSFSIKIRALMLSFFILIYSILKMRSLIHMRVHEELVVSMLNMFITTFPYLLLLGGLWITEEKFQSLYQRANVSRLNACLMVLCTTITGLLIIHRFHFLDISHAKIASYRSVASMRNVVVSPMYFSNTALCRGFSIACAIKRMFSNFCVMLTISHISLLPLYLLSLIRREGSQS